jgi:hypothetical protein
VLDQQMEEVRLRNALHRISSGIITITFPERLTPFCFPIIVDGLSRVNLSSEKFRRPGKAYAGATGKIIKKNPGFLPGTILKYYSINK